VIHEVINLIALNFRISSQMLMSTFYFKSAAGVLMVCKDVDRGRESAILYVSVRNRVPNQEELHHTESSTEFQFNSSQ
jgi:hypothetical protein